MAMVLSVRNPFALYLVLGIKDIENRPTGITEANINKRIYIQVSKKRPKLKDLKDIYGTLRKRGYLNNLPIIEGLPVINGESNFKEVYKYFHNTYFEGKIIGSLTFTGTSTELEWSFWYGWPPSATSHYKRELVAWLVNKQTCEFWNNKKWWISATGNLGLVSVDGTVARKIELVEFVCFFTLYVFGGARGRVRFLLTKFLCIFKKKHVTAKKKKSRKKKRKC